MSDAKSSFSGHFAYFSNADLNTFRWIDPVTGYQGFGSTSVSEIMASRNSLSCGEAIFARMDQGGEITLSLHFLCFDKWWPAEMG